MKIIKVESCGECPFFIDEYCGIPSYCERTDENINDMDKIRSDCPLEDYKE